MFRSFRFAHRTHVGDCSGPAVSMSYGSGNFSGHVCFARQLEIGGVVLSKDTHRRCGESAPEAIGLTSTTGSGKADAAAGATPAENDRFQPFKFAGIEQNFRVLQCAHHHAYVGKLSERKAGGGGSAGSRDGSDGNVASSTQQHGVASSSSAAAGKLPERGTYEWAQSTDSPRQRSQTGIVGMAYVRFFLPSPLLVFSMPLF
jgi:hypothetical protein